MTLRPYQQDASDAALDWMRRSVEPAVIEAVTAAGKSHVIADMALRIHDMTGKRILCLAPSAELVQQNREKLIATGTPALALNMDAGVPVAISFSRFCWTSSALGARHRTRLPVMSWIRRAMSAMTCDLPAAVTASMHAGSTLCRIQSIAASDAAC